MDANPLFVSSELREPGAHFRWLADYQVGGLSYSEVAKKYGQYSQSTVGRIIKRTATLVGLVLRSPGKRGRPPKSSA